MRRIGSDVNNRGKQAGRDTSRGNHLDGHLGHFVEEARRQVVHPGSKEGREPLAELRVLLLVGVFLFVGSCQ